MPTTSGITGTNTTQTTGTAAGSIMGKDDFLQLFVTQLKYQDPLSPMKNEAFASQLAQFTQLEELQNMNKNLEQSIITNLNMSQGINNSLATTMIGKSVKTSGSEFSYSTTDSDPKLNFNLAYDAEKVKVKIYDSTGALVKTLEQHNMGKGDNFIQWDGSNDNHGNASDGNYTYTVEATGANDSKISATPFQLLKITGVKYIDGLANLLSGDLVIPYSQVMEIVQQSGSSTGSSASGSSIL